ncbi:MAG: hypothetical protein AAF624_13040 [Bacteroidota bacterium]
MPALLCRRHATLLTLALVVAAATVPDSSAQFDRLRDRARKAAEEVRGGQMEDAEQERPDAGQATVEDPRRRPAVGDVASGDSDALPPLVYDRPFAPAIRVDRILDYVEFEANGRFALTDFTAVFVPTQDANGAAVDYYDQQRMHVKLVKGGAEVWDRYYSGSSVHNGPSMDFSFNRTLTNNKRPEANYEPGVNDVLAAGAYQLDFFLDDRHFWSLPFEVVSMGTSDPYSTRGASLFLRGLWDDIGYVSFNSREIDASPQVYFSFYKQALRADLERRTEFEYVAVIKRSGRTVAAHDIDRTCQRVDDPLGAYTQADHSTGPYTASFYLLPQDCVGSPKVLRMEHLIDGAYTLELTLTGPNVDNEVRTYSFEIAEGRFVPAGQQVRDATDPTRYLEGMNEVWFYVAE